MNTEETQWAEGRAAGEAWARRTGTTEADLRMVPVVKGTSTYKTAFRVGVAKVRNERHLNENGITRG